MKWYVLFLLLTFTGGLLFWKVESRWRNLALLGLCMLLTFVFFFLNKI